MPRYWGFFGQSFRYISNMQPYLNTTGLYDDLLLLSSFTFSITQSVLLSHLVYVFQFLHLFFLDVLSQNFIKHSRKAFVYICINNIYQIYFRKLMNVSLPKTFMIFLFHLFDLQIECQISNLKKQICNKQQRFTRQHRELQSTSFNNL